MKIPERLRQPMAASLPHNDVNPLRGKSNLEDVI